MPLLLLSAGAAQAVSTPLIPVFEARHSVKIAASFGAVGFLRDRLVAGEACDVIVLSAALIAELTGEGWIARGSSRDLGTVATGIAIASSASCIPPGDSAGLCALLESARGIYVPDLERSTAGRHVAKVLRALGLADVVASRIQEFPNGAAAMSALAQAEGDGLIGCTQATEILQTPGLRFVANLPGEHALETTYTAAVTSGASDPALAAAFIEALTGEGTRATRIAAGFIV